MKINLNRHTLKINLHKLQVNQILVDGGFAPEWIMLKRDIIEQQDQLRELLRSKCVELLSNDNKSKHHRKNDDIGHHPDPHIHIKHKWNKCCEIIENDNETLTTHNKNIDRFNLIVPLMKSQMFHFNVKREADKIFASVIETFERDNMSQLSVDPTEVQNKVDTLEQTKCNSHYGSPTMALEALLKDFLNLIGWRRKSDIYNPKP